MEHPRYSEAGSIASSQQPKVISVQLARETHQIAPECQDECFDYEIFRKSLGNRGYKNAIIPDLEVIEYQGFVYDMSHHRCYNCHSRTKGISGNGLFPYSNPISNFYYVGEK